jgi:catechol 2,3-dioxygenase-like lactoylglutathione lyase family enzyme
VRVEDPVRVLDRPRPDRDRRAGEHHPDIGVHDIDAAIAHLRGHDVTVEDWHEVPGMVRLSTFHDPDGTPWMLAQTLQPKGDRR